MKNIISLCLLLLLLALHSICGVSTINPANYIWINYGTKVTLRSNDQASYSVRLPCESRIGKCSYQFTVLPPGWNLNSDGTINIPRLDASRSGTFAIEGKFSEPTGQRIDAKLVASIQNGMLSVMDNKEYYKKIGYSLPPEEDAPKSSKYEESVLIKSLPNGFTPIDQLQKQIISGNISNITTMLDQVLKKFAPCRSKINYLTQVKDLVNKLIKANNDQLKNHADSIKQLEKDLSKLQNRKQNEFLVRGVTKEIEELNKKETSLNQQKRELEQNETYYKSMAQKSLNSMNGYPINVDLLGSPEMDRMVQIITQTNKDLEGYYNESIRVRKQLAQEKLRQYSVGVSKNISSPIQNSLSVSNQLLINNLIYKINNQVKLDNFEYIKYEEQELGRVLNKKIEGLSPSGVSKQDIIQLLRKINAQSMMISRNLDYLSVLNASFASCK